jgi:glycosyltransferase involved in cell wall biosynthesis
VVVPNGGGVLSYAHDGNARLVPATAEGFAAGIADTLDDRDPARRACARQTAADHAWPVVARRYFDMLDALHARRVTRPYHEAAPISATSPGL